MVVAIHSRYLVGMSPPFLRSRWARRAVGAGVGLLPHAVVLVFVGWGPTGNDNVGEWYFGLAFLGVCPALAGVLVAAVLLHTKLRDVGLGLMGAVGTLVLFWVVGLLAYGAVLVPPGMIEAPRMR
jgi:hypothetical protein